MRTDNIEPAPTWSMYKVHYQSFVTFYTRESLLQKAIYAMRKNMTEMEKTNWKLFQRKFNPLAFKFMILFFMFFHDMFQVLFSLLKK